MTPRVDLTPRPGAGNAVRAFDVGESVDSDVQVIAFLRATASPWQQRIAVARRSDPTQPFGAPISMPWYHNAPISGGVAISSMADQTGNFVIAVGGEP